MAIDLSNLLRPTSGVGSRVRLARGQLSNRSRPPNLRGARFTVFELWGIHPPRRVFELDAGLYSPRVQLPAGVGMMKSYAVTRV
jgi:hypothetical protein